MTDWTVVYQKLKKNRFDINLFKSLYLRTDTNRTASNTSAGVAGLLAQRRSSHTQIIDQSVQDNRTANDRLRSEKLKLWWDELSQDLSVSWRDNNVTKITIVAISLADISVFSASDNVPVWASSIASYLDKNDMNVKFSHFFFY